MIQTTMQGTQAHTILSTLDTPTMIRAITDKDTPQATAATIHRILTMGTQAMTPTIATRAITPHRTTTAGTNPDMILTNQSIHQVLTSLVADTTIRAIMEIPITTTQVTMEDQATTTHHTGVPLAMTITDTVPLLQSI